MVAAALLPTTIAFAEEVSADEARTAVENWLASGAAMGCSKLAAGIVSNVDSYKGSGGTGRFHAVSLRGEDGSKRGYVVTSAETKMTPVIAYSDEGEFVATDDNPLWVLLSGSVKAASDAMVEDAKAVETANAAGGGRRLLKSAAGTANERKWAALLASRRGQEDANALPREYALTKNPSDLRVPALVKTKWGQDTIGGKSGAAKCFNYYTPNNYVCGCVATASAQIMRYFRWPRRAVEAKTFTCQVDGTATKLTMKGGTYDWDSMLVNINDYAEKSKTDPESVSMYCSAIGRLCYDSGVALGMAYAKSGSGSHTTDIYKTLRNVFGYSYAAMVYRGDGLDAKEFNSIILPSLDAKRPVAVAVAGYRVSDESRDSRHSIVADGYGYSGGTLYVHYNMGWDGSANAWYTQDLIDTSYYHYTNFTVAVHSIFTVEKAESPIASGRVLDEGGNPVSGAKVTATLAGGVVAEATSDERGIYALILPPSSSTKKYTVSAKHRGYVSSSGATTTVSASRTISGTTSDAYITGSGSTSNSTGHDLVLSRPGEGLKWIEEDEGHWEITGSWRDSSEYIDGRIEFAGREEFTANSSSDGRNVNVVTTVNFAFQSGDGDGSREDVKAAVRIGTNGCFQVCAGVDGAERWLDVQADGITPATGTDYTFAFALDMTNGTYKVAVVGDGGTTNRLAHGTTNTFAFASGDTPKSVGCVGFDGTGSVTSILGTYDDTVLAFAAGDTVLKGGVGALTQKLADWLNGFDDYDGLKARLALMTADDLSAAHLLNLDLMGGECDFEDFKNNYSFTVDGITVDGDTASVEVRLWRRAVRADDASVNGKAALYAGVTPNVGTDGEPLVEEPLAIDVGQAGSTARAVLTFERIDALGSPRFFRAKIRPVDTGTTMQNMQ